MASVLSVVESRASLEGARSAADTRVGGGQYGQAARWASTEAAEGQRLSLQVKVLGRDRAEVRIGGVQPLRLSRRQSEVLVLLGASPQGLTGERLALALYGEDGNPLSARAEVSRLRRVLGDWVLAEPYRVQPGASCDIATLRRLLSDSRTTEALGAYPGPLLPRSDAPGVIDLRNEIDDWVRRSVMSADDPEALWRWLSTPSGAEDMPAWKRFLANLEADDGRRGLAAARLARLRDGMGVYGAADHELLAVAR